MLSDIFGGRQSNERSEVAHKFDARLLDFARPIGGRKERIFTGQEWGEQYRMGGGTKCKNVCGKTNETKKIFNRACSIEKGST